MSDADEARSAKALQEIAHHLKELVKTQASLNENIVTFIRDAREFADQFSSVSLVDPSQMSIEDIAAELHKMHQRARQQGPEEFPLILTFHANQIVKVRATEQFGKVCVVGVEGDDGQLKVEVEMNGTGEKLLFSPAELQTDPKS